MPVSYRSLDRRIRRDEKELHDFLWHPGWKGGPETLRRNVLRDARDLDAFIGAGGKLRRNAEALAREPPAWEREPAGGVGLFELLSHTFFLAAARHRTKRGDFKGAGEDVREVVGSVSIGTCSEAGCFEFVNEWEAGKTNFEAYTGKLADFLESKGVSGAGEFKRVLNAAWSLAGLAGDASSKTEAELATRAAIANAAWCAAAVVPIRRAVVKLSDVPFKDLPAIITKAASV